MKLAWDSQQFKVAINHIDIHLSPETIQPFPVDAIVLEQDTSLVLEPDNELRDPGDDRPVWYDANKAELLKSHQVGDVLVKSCKPLQLLAIVHDLDHDPSWQSAWIKSALYKVFDIAEQQSLSAIRLPILGARHGRFKLDSFIDILQPLINNNDWQHLKQIWLVVPAKDCQLTFKLLDL